MLAAVGEEGRVARPQGRRGVIEGELSERYEVRPLIASITRRGEQDSATSAITPFMCSTLLVDSLSEWWCHKLWLCGEPKISVAPSASCRLVQNALVKRVSRSDTFATKTDDKTARPSPSVVGLSVLGSGIFVTSDILFVCCLFRGYSRPGRPVPRTVPSGYSGALPVTEALRLRLRPGS